MTGSEYFYGSRLQSDCLNQLGTVGGAVVFAVPVLGFELQLTSRQCYSFCRLIQHWYDINRLIVTGNLATLDPMCRSTEDKFNVEVNLRERV